ncbi:MAG: guanylate kinase [Opitutae bacterium]|nr:guanylate kinase [Opitutae bacterium]|tara:strand:- start:7929 stop:8555 length:627 start_codon:yes stop_codon:yes gene_type:complete
MPDLRRAGGLLLIVSGPAGCGKTTVCDRLYQSHVPKLNKVITTTTREPREGEKDGVDYHFVSNRQFDDDLNKDAFYEHAIVHGSKYGVFKAAILGKLETGLDLVLNVDVQGAATLRKAAANDPLLGASLVSLFLMPANLETIRQRLDERGKDDAQEIARRLKVAENEVARWREYDYCIVSGSKEDDYARIDAIYKAEKIRVKRLVDEG